MKKISKVGLAGVLATTSFINTTGEVNATENNNTATAEVSNQLNLSEHISTIRDGDFTVKTKFKTSSRNGVASVAFVGKKEAKDNYLLFYLKDGKLGYEVKPNVGLSNANTIGSNLADGKYHDITISFSSSRKTMFIIIDGKLAHSKELTDANVAMLRAGLFNQSNYVGVGTGIRGGGGNPYPFTGTFKETEIQDTALKQDLVAHKISNNQKATINDIETINQLKKLKNATITGTFLGNASSGKSTLFKLTGENNQSFDFYVDPSKNGIGVDIVSGRSKKNFPLNNTHLQKKGINLKDGKLHTASLVHIENGHAGQPTYEFYIDGKYIDRYRNTEWTLAKKLTNANNIEIATENTASNVIDVTVIPAAMGEKEIGVLHNTKEKDRNIYSEPGLAPKPISLFYTGYDNSPAYRIPSLFTTNLGTQIAAIDKRRSGFGDQGNIDTLIRRKEANQTEFGESKVILDAAGKGNYTPLLIDPSILQAKDGTIYMIVDMFPQSRALMGIYSGEPMAASSGYKEVDGKKYLKLYTNVTKTNPGGSGDEYTVRENGIVYNSLGEKTEYQVELGDNIKEPYNEIGSLFKNGEYKGNIFINNADGVNDDLVGELKAVRTSYLWLTKSKDDGKTWSKPIDLNAQVKPEWATFLGVGPGIGLTMDNGDLAFPVYSINSSGFSSQSSHLIISRDNGNTWTLGESPQKTRGYDPAVGPAPNNVGVLTEAQAFQAKNGHVVMFMRTSNKGRASALTYAVSRDRGQTWYKVDKFGTDASPLVYETDTQMSNIHFEYAGKEYVLHSGPGRFRRNDGALTLGEITYDSNNEVVITWQPKKLYAPGDFAYSSITYLGNGKFASLYEADSGKIEHVEFDMDWLTKPQIVTPIESLTVDTKTSGYYLGEDNHLYVWVKTNAPTFIMSNPTINLEINGEELTNKAVIPYTDGFFIDAGTLENPVNTLKLKSVNSTNGKIVTVNGNELALNNDVIKVYAEEDTTVKTTELELLVAKTNEIKDNLVTHSRQLVETRLAEITTLLAREDKTQAEVNAQLVELTKLNREVIYSHIFNDFKAKEYTQYTAEKYRTIYPDLHTKVSAIETKLENGEISDRQTLLNEMMKFRAYVNTLKPAHLVTYNLEGGVNSEENLFYAKEGETKALLPATKENYVFKGWYNGETKVENLENVTADLTLTAKWELDPVVVNNKKLKAKDEIDLAKFHKDYEIALSDASEDAKNNAREEVLRLAEQEKAKIDAQTTLEGIDTVKQESLVTLSTKEIPTAAKELEVSKVDILGAIDNVTSEKIAKIDASGEPEHVRELLKTEVRNQTTLAKEKVGESKNLQESLTRYQIGLSNIENPKVAVNNYSEIKEQKVTEVVAVVEKQKIEIPNEEKVEKDNTLGYGEEVVAVEGAKGEKVVEKVGEEILKETTTKAPVTRVVKQGTNKETSKPKVAPTVNEKPVAVVEKQKVELPNEEKVEKDNTLGYGEEVVAVEGAKGEKVVEKVGEEILKETTTKVPVTRVVKQGTNKETSKPKVAPTVKEMPTAKLETSKPEVAPTINEMPTAKLETSKPKVAPTVKEMPVANIEKSSQELVQKEKEEPVIKLEKAKTDKKEEKILSKTGVSNNSGILTTIGIIGLSALILATKRRKNK